MTREHADRGPLSRDEMAQLVARRNWILIGVTRWLMAYMTT